MAPPEDLRVEYEKQIENIRKLRTLYEERAAATLLEHRRELEREEARITVLEAKLRELHSETDEVKEAKKELEGKIELLENTIQHKDTELEVTKDSLFSSTVHNKSLSSQMRLINNLFSHMLVSPRVDLDRLARLLKENRGLISDFTLTGDSNEIAALLVDLAEQVEKEQNQEENNAEEESVTNVESEIASNLSKVWRVLVELLSHHQSSTPKELSGGSESCYKCVQTPSGPRSVISVSQTFLTLKDLILEKNQLVIEVGRLKTLNNHLENRLGSQEKRLSVVTSELRKTWGVVNKLKAQHKQLHTHEKILRYELQQKRCMLTELKQELEYCRDKWDKAREKNSQTEEDWKRLRKEFASRKLRKESNSAESGYEEDDITHSPPTESINHEDVFKPRSHEGSEPEAIEDEIDHSDGNSFDTVIDLLDVTYIENQSERGLTASPFLISEMSPESLEISPNLLPLTSSEFTEGLDQIESEDLAAVLDIHYQNQLIGTDYNLSLPSSNRSSPIPNEIDDFASSEMDVSEEDSSSNHHQVLPTVSSLNQTTPEATSLCSSSSNNISKFLEGLFVENGLEGNSTSKNENLVLSAPSTSQNSNEEGSAIFCNNRETFLVDSNQNSCQVPVTQLPQEKVCKEKIELSHVQKWVTDSQVVTHKSNSNQESACKKSSCEQLCETQSQEEILNIREERLKKLEKQCRSLVSKATSKSFRNETTTKQNDELNLSGSSSQSMSNTEKNVTTSVVAPFDCDPSSNSIATTLNNKELENVSTHAELPQPFSQVQKRSSEQVLEARAARLTRLEDQCKTLFTKMSATSSRSELISNKVDELHESYKGSEQTITEQITSKKCPLNQKLPSFESTYGRENNCSTNNFPINNDESMCVRSSDLSSESKQVLNSCSLPGPSLEPIDIPSVDYKKSRTPEQILEARAERFKRLEEQCKSLVSKMTATSLRSEIIANKLDELHTCYGTSDDASSSKDSSIVHWETRRNPTPTASPRLTRKIDRMTAVDNKQIKANDANKIETNSLKQDSCDQEIISCKETNNEEDSIRKIKEDANGSKKFCEETLDARREGHLENGCNSILSNMSDTSQNSDVITNRLDEFHKQEFNKNQNDTSSQTAVSLISPSSSNIEEFTESNQPSKEMTSTTTIVNNSNNETKSLSTISKDLNIKNDFESI